MTIVYLNVSVTDCDSNANINKYEQKTSHDIFTKFYKSDCLLNLNDIDPLITNRNFRSQVSFVSINVSSEISNFTRNIYTCLSNLQLDQVKRMIFKNEKDELYDFNLYDTHNYYIFILVLN